MLSALQESFNPDTDTQSAQLISLPASDEGKINAYSAG